ncbi:hydroxyacylglutathione hydrolase [Acidobacteriota bacterium]
MPLIEPVPAYSDNYIWLITDPPSPSAVVVDPGEASLVLQILQKRNLELGAVLLTHHHGDHIGGVDEILREIQVPVFGPATENIAAVDHPVEGGDFVPLPDLGLDLEVIDVPGHTAGHIAYRGPDFALVGDTLFAGGCGRVFEGTPEQMYASLIRLAKLPDETQVYCAHEYTIANLSFAREVEPYNEALAKRLEEAHTARAEGRPTVPSTIAEELATNPFLRCDQSAVIATAEARAGLDLPTAVDVFAVIRGWKDSWQG